MAALYDAQRSIDILALWEQKDVKDLVCDINEKNECLWLMMFESAYMETNLESFIKYMSTFKEKASVNAVFQMEWMLARLYSIFDMKNKKYSLQYGENEYNFNVIRDISSSDNNKILICDIAEDLFVYIRPNIDINGEISENKSCIQVSDLLENDIIIKEIEKGMKEC